MTIEQLQYFYAVTIHQTFSQAAAEMNITQSALSKQIAKLEQEATDKSLLQMQVNNS